MLIFIWGLYILPALLWADWRKWQLCYPTYLFMVAANFFASILMFNHTLWLFHPTFLLPNHTFTEFYIAFVAYPPIVLLFLSRYPAQGLPRQLGWIFLWTALLSVSELIPYYFGVMTYKNNWSFFWSAIHNIVMFSTLRLHYKNWVWAWLLAALYLIFIWFHFNFDIQNLKYW